MTCTRAEFAPLIALLSALYPERKTDPAMTEAYYQILNDIDIELLKAATLQLAANPETNFFPRAGALRTAAFALVETASGTPSADDAWDELMKAIGKYGVYRKPEFSHPLIQQALDGIGGWRTLCMSDESETSYTRDAFKKTFATVLKRERNEMQMLPAVRAIAARFAGRGPALAAGAKAPQLTDSEG